MENTDLFEPAVEFPNSDADARYEALVGLDEVKDILLKEAQLLLDPALLTAWSVEHYQAELPIVAEFGQRIPLFIFAGDVGVGKSELAETFGSILARREGIPVRLLKLSLSARGSGKVGEMTMLISAAFDQVRAQAPRPQAGAKPASATVLLIDEADAIAQSRTSSQMHHEDRAGVNAIIRGVNQVSDDGLPIVTVLCTNRLSAIDPAVERRAAHVFTFERPSGGQRREILSRALEGTGMSDSELDHLAEITGGKDGSGGYTYSDLRSKLIPSIVLDAFPDSRVEFERVCALANEIEPSRILES